MLEIFGLLIAVGGIATLARGRGASPFAAGAIAISGYVLIVFGGAFIVSPGPDRIWLTVAAWAWIGIVFLYLRFVVGSKLKKPEGKWSCSNCHYLNNASSVVCEACQQAWQASQ